MSTTTTDRSAIDEWTRLARRTGVTGLVTFVLLFVPIIAISTVGEPPFLATADEARAFFVAGSAGWVQSAMAASALGGLGLIWFVVGLALLLARAEPGPPWRSGVALVSGVLMAAYLLLDASWDAASFGGAEIELAVASYAFDVGNLGFANAWLGMGSFALATGWVVVSTRLLSRWLGWWGIAAGVGLIVVRFVWTSEVWLVPYAAFWIWVVVVCVQLLRRRPPMVPPSARSS